MSAASMLASVPMFRVRSQDKASCCLCPQWVANPLTDMYADVVTTVVLEVQSNPNAQKREAAAAAAAAAWMRAGDPPDSCLCVSS